MGGTEHGPIFLALVIFGAILGIVASRGAILQIAPMLVLYGMAGLLADQQIAWNRMPASPQSELSNSNNVPEFWWQMEEALRWRPRRDLSLPAHPDENF
jgi:hypothetical protein